MEMGDYAAAGPLFQRALKIWDAIGRDDRDTAGLLNNLALSYTSQGNYEAAESLLQRALKINEATEETAGPNTAAALNNIALLYLGKEDWATAAEYFERALRIYDESPGVDIKHTAVCLTNLARAYTRQRKYTAAEPLLQRSLKMHETALEPGHPNIGHAVSALAQFYFMKQDYDQARSLRERALGIFEASLGNEHPITATELCNQGSTYFRLGKPDEALNLVGSSLAIHFAILERTASVQTEQQQILMARKASECLDWWLIISADANSPVPQTWRHVVAWKGQTATRQLQLRQALRDDPQYAQLRQATQAWSSLTLNPPLSTVQKNRDDWQRRRTELAKEVGGLEQDLSRKYAEFRNNLERQHVSPEDIQAALRKQKNPTVLIDLLEYRGSEPRIAAFVVRGDREIVRVELGSAKRVSDLVDRWRESLSIGRGRESRQAAQELRQTLWEPLSLHLADAAIVLISPDGQVCRFPWGALPGTKPESYLLEERAIAMIPTPQLLPAILADRPRVPHKGDLALLVGDVDFDAPPAVAKNDQESQGNGQLSGLDPPVKKLDGTRREIMEIAALHKKLVGKADSTSMLTGAQATEMALNELAPAATYLHVATHGYFQATSPRQGMEQPSQDNPQFHVRSALLLAGVNKPRPWSVADGNWTAQEVGTLDLSKAELVVLSACDTGVGTVVGGEGVLGLQRSFHGAGARTCIASLWKVDDNATQELMTEFYRNLWEKKLPKLEALRQAQLKMLHEYDPKHAPNRGTEVELAPLHSGRPDSNTAVRNLIAASGLSLVVFALWLIVRIIKRGERWAKRTAAALALALAMSPFTAAPATRLFERVFPPAALPVAFDSKPSADSPQEPGPSPYYWAAFVLSGDWR
ncbi:MAG: CHAT domain-containing protein [Planctomycetes bacterium]|nr:CHAT domain-containing protein [Planctomycetota bacterium]